MIYELTIENNKDKAIIDFLKQLDCVKIKRVRKVASPAKKKKTSGDGDFPYFGIAKDWDIEASELRKSSSKKRLSEW